MTSVFTWLVGTWFANFAFAHHISNSWCATRNPVPDSTYYLADLKSVTTESQNVSPCMTATPWRRVNYWKMCDENSTFACFDAICRKFNLAVWTSWGSLGRSKSRHLACCGLTWPKWDHGTQACARNGLIWVKWDHCKHARRGRT